MSAPSSTSTDPPPTTELSLLCPHCDYNLTGLAAPRCPECGNTFEWLDLSAEARWRNSLFETRPTLLNYLRTQWRALAPSFPQHLLLLPRVRYGTAFLSFLISALVCLLVWSISMTAAAAMNQYGVSSQHRVWRANPMYISPFPEQIDDEAPLPRHSKFWILTARRIPQELAITIPILVLAVPLSALIATQLMKDSLRHASRTKLRAAHTMLYAVDPFVPAVCLAVAALAYFTINFDSALPFNFNPRALSSYLLLGYAIAAAHALLRLENFARTLYSPPNTLSGMGILIAFLTPAILLLLFGIFGALMHAFSAIAS